MDCNWRTKLKNTDMKVKPNEAEISQALLGNDIQWIKSKLSEIEIKVSNHFVTKEEFEPYKRLIQGLIAVAMTSVVGAVMTLILIK